MLESSDETAVDSLEPELVEIGVHEVSIAELEPEGLTDKADVVPVPVQSSPNHGETYLRRPNFRVDVESDGESELLMTSEEADSLLSSR